MASQVVIVVKNLPANAIKDEGLIPGSPLPSPCWWCYIGQMTVVVMF